MILCDGNYGMGVYGIDSVHNREPERSRVTICPGHTWVKLFTFEAVPYPYNYVCHIWSRSDGRVERGTVFQ